MPPYVGRHKSYGESFSIEIKWLGGGSVNCRMATRCPTGAVAHKRPVIDVADVDAGACCRPLRLGVAFKAQIGIALHQHFGVNGAVRTVTDRAAFSHRCVFENHRAGLFSMALGASLILARHGESACRLHDVHAMGIVTLHAVHFAFNDWMVLREMEFRAGFLMALEAAFGIFSRVDDEFFKPAAASHGDVFAAGAMTRFAATLAGHVGSGETQSRMRARRKHSGNIRMAIDASLVADVSCAFNLKGDHHRSFCGAGV